MLGTILTLRLYWVRPSHGQGGSRFETQNKCLVTFLSPCNYVMTELQLKYWAKNVQVMSTVTPSRHLQRSLKWRTGPDKIPGSPSFYLACNFLPLHLVMIRNFTHGINAAKFALFLLIQSLRKWFHSTCDVLRETMPIVEPSFLWYPQK